jgi:hypothetical protein
MSVSILVGKAYEGASDEAVFYCSTTGWAFGPVMGSREEAEAFQVYLGCDPREVREEELRDRYTAFRREMMCDCCGELRVVECDRCAEAHADGYPCDKQPAPAAGEQWHCNECCKVCPHCSQPKWQHRSADWYHHWVLKQREQQEVAGA